MLLFTTMVEGLRLIGFDRQQLTEEAARFIRRDSEEGGEYFRILRERLLGSRFDCLKTALGQLDHEQAQVAKALDQLRNGVLEIGGPGGGQVYETFLEAAAYVVTFGELSLKMRANMPYGILWLFSSIQLVASAEPWIGNPVKEEDIRDLYNNDFLAGLNRDDSEAADAMFRNAYEELAEISPILAETFVAIPVKEIPEGMEGGEPQYRQEDMGFIHGVVVGLRALELARGMDGVNPWDV